MKYDINKTPTKDFENLELMEIVDNSIYVQTKEIYGFDKCYGFVHLRSRVLRRGKEENRLFNTVKGGIVDAGFVGHINFIIELNQKIIVEDEIEVIKKHLNSCAQIILFPVQTNYYDGTNQTNLNPQIQFYS